MPTESPVLTIGDSVPGRKLASGQQLSALLRDGTTLLSLAEIEPPRRRDAEKAPEVARRAVDKKTK
jgi:hypothetical protein